jgi:hypothetical protein
MDDKRYRVEIQANNSRTWEPVHYTDSLPVAKRHVAATVKSVKIQAARVVNQITGQVMAYEQG